MKRLAGGLHFTGADSLGAAWPEPGTKGQDINCCTGGVDSCDAQWPGSVQASSLQEAPGVSELRRVMCGASACRAMATVLRQGREIALQLVKESPSGGMNGLSRDGLTREEARAEDERQTGALKARKLDCRVRPWGRGSGCSWQWDARRTSARRGASKRASWLPRAPLGSGVRVQLAVRAMCWTADIPAQLAWSPRSADAALLAAAACECLG